MYACVHSYNASRDVNRIIFMFFAATFRQIYYRLETIMLQFSCYYSVQIADVVHAYISSIRISFGKCH